MPPVTKAGGTEFRKDVSFVTKDADEQVASGIVMVPDKADLQNDFAREETIQEFADQFEDFEEAGQAGGGIMHAVWPDGWMELERNEVLDEAEEIGGETVEAGAWVQDWSIENDELWGAIDEGILSGYSIGAIQVDWDGPFEPGEVDDVDTSEIPDGDLVWELTDGIIREVSAVDIPAVPDALIHETKADRKKRLADYVGDQDGFIEAAMDRGHSEDEAEFLWDLLNAAVEVDGSSDPGKQSGFAAAGKAFLKELLGSDDGTEAKRSPEAPEAGAEKEGRTLSRQNEADLKASVDAAVSILNDAGVDHGITRFTDREDDDFDLSEHSAREFSTPDEDEEPDSIDDVVANDADDNAPAGDTADDTQTMSDDDTTDDPMADAPEWAKALNDRIDEIEGDAEKAESDDPETTDEEKPEWAKSLESRLDDLEKDVGIEDEEEKPDWAKDLEQRIDTIAQQSGHSQQLEASADGGEDEEDDGGLGGLGKALS